MIPVNNLFCWDRKLFHVNYFKEHQKYPVLSSSKFWLTFRQAPPSSVALENKHFALLTFDIFDDDQKNRNIFVFCKGSIGGWGRDQISKFRQKIFWDHLLASVFACFHPFQKNHHILALKNKPIYNSQQCIQEKHVL